MASSSAPMAMRRSTRQQSRDPESAAPASPAKGRGRPRTNHGASTGAYPPTARSLAAVAAEATDFEQGHSMFVEQADPLQQSPGGRSDLTSRTVANITAMQSSGAADKLPILLPELYAKSASLLHTLVPPSKAKADWMETLLANLQMPGSSESTRVRVCEERLHEVFSQFSNNLQFISPELVLKATLRVHDGSSITLGAWRPDSVLQKANIATLAADLIPPESRSDGGGALQRLDNFFPQPFLSKFAAGTKIVQAGDSKMSDQSFKLGLAIRTQLAITRLTALGGEPTHSHNQMLQDIFYDSEGNVRPFSVAWAGRDGFFSAVQEKAIEQRFEALQALLHDPNDDGLKNAENEFSWLGFKMELVKWIRDRVKEIDDSVAKCSGADEISQKWGAEIQKTMTQSDEPRVYPSASSEQHLKAVNKRKRGPERPSDSSWVPPIEGEGEPGDPAALGSVLGREARGNIDSSVPVDPQLEAKLEHNRNEAWRNTGVARLTDPQPSGQKIFYDDSQMSQLPQASPSPHKRRRPNENDGADAEPSQDVGFQNDEQQADMIDQRRQQLNEMQTAEALRNHVHPGQPSEQMLTQGQDYPYADGQPSTRPAPSQGAEYMRTQAISKSMTAITSKERPPQQRKAWTVGEVDALIIGIGHHGNGYAKLKEEDQSTFNHLGDRDPESLRHKARNMKFDYLKAGVALPDGFDKVLLDKKFKDKLESLGVPYHQDQARRAPAIKSPRKKKE